MAEIPARDPREGGDIAPPTGPEIQPQPPAPEIQPEPQKPEEIPEPPGPDVIPPPPGKDLPQWPGHGTKG